MTDFITMTCKSCGGKLQITPEIDNFACMYCGTEFRVKREGGVVVLSPLVEEIKKVSVSTDKTASELAIIRLEREVSDLNGELELVKSEINQLNNDLTNSKNMVDFLISKEEEYKKIAFYETNVRIIISFIALLNITFLFIYSLLVEMRNQNLGMVFLISLLISLIFLIILVWWNPFDYLQKKKNISNVKQIERIKSKVEQEKMKIENKKEIQKELENKISRNHRELENHLKIVGGDV